MDGLESARREMGERMQKLAGAKEEELTRLGAQVKNLTQPRRLRRRRKLLWTTRSRIQRSPGKKEDNEAGKHEFEDAGPKAQRARDFKSATEPVGAVCAAKRERGFAQQNDCTYVGNRAGSGGV